MRFVHLLKSTWPILLVAVLLSACDSESSVVDPDDDGNNGEIPVPAAYTFDSRFEEGASSVAYPGQTVRNLLIQDIKILIDNLAKDGAQSITTDQLLRLYDYEDSYDMATLTGTGALGAKETRYSSIATDKDLVGKISSTPLIGLNKTADELVRGYFEQIAANSQNSNKLATQSVYTTEDGVDMSQMINKVLLGAVSYYQGTGVYLATLFDRDNSQPKEGKPYTDMEHAWDEAFGYFGAARDYHTYTDDALAGGVEDYARDANGDGLIDFESEYNFAFAKNAGKRDKGGTGVDFTKEIFDAFLAGRTAIANQTSPAEIAEYRDAVARGWEKVIAATVVHYINDTLEDMAELTQAEVDGKNNANLNKHWAEMKGYAYALQFNPFKQITDDQLADLHALLGDAPVYALPGTSAYEAYVSALNDAKAIFQEAYGFSDENMAGW